MVDRYWCDMAHLLRQKFIFEFHSADSEDKLYMGNSSSSMVEGKGTVNMKFTSGKVVTLLNVLYVLDIRKNLVSGPLLNKKWFKLVFESDKFVLTKGCMFMGKGYLTKGHFKLSIVIVNGNGNRMIVSAYMTVSTYMIESFDIWHARLGHVNNILIHKMAHLNMLPKFKIDLKHKCEVCAESKFARQTFKSVQERSNELLDLIHSDLCDFKSNPTRGGKNYYITFIDDCRKYCHVFLIKNKREAFDVFKIYKAEVENQLDKKIKVLKTDRGGEYDSIEFAEFCNTNGIIYQTTAPYTPQQNGVAERKNRTFKNMINSMLDDSGLPQNLWGEALLTANHILNRVHSKKSDNSPYEIWRKRKPTYKTLKVWGCLAKIQIPLPKRTKL
ncbi:hypothetical protein Scep_017142 [Stephania cephalantha]|uniref:Integrase catalytic domain-containing protein n=1 Tax=Stephania cephalantha TaxID=152367 RepID=A0AAP0NUR8_9MAGN